jgi:hypothetical protein
MTLKQDNVQDLIDGEQKYLAEAKEKYGEYFNHAIEFGNFLSTFITSIDPDRFIFAAFLSQVRKNYFLSFFSALRLHHVQAGMDLRQMLESGAWAAYAIANPEQEKFTISVGGLLETPEKLLVARNAWLDQNFKAGSDAIKRLKGLINASVAHASIVYAFNNFRLDVKAGKFESPYFDFEDRFQVKFDLWFMSNVALGLIDLFFGINRGRNVIKLSPTFTEGFKPLETENIRLKTEMLKGRAASDPRPDRGIKK